MNLECEHGQLARSCNICEYEREIAELRARVAELEAERDKLRDDLSGDKAILQNLLYREHEEKRTLEDALTEERQRTRLSEAVIRENEVLTKENMELNAELKREMNHYIEASHDLAIARDEWKRIATEAKARFEWLLADMREIGVAE